MKVTMFLDKEDVQEAVLEYLTKHRPDLIIQREDKEAGTRAPFIRFTVSGKQVDALQVEIDQYFHVHDNPHPYR